MSHSMRHLLIGIVVFLVSAAGVVASVIPDSWSLGIGITAIGGPEDSEGHTFTTVASDFVNMHEITLNGSRTAAQYRIQVAQTFADYLFRFQQDCVDQNNLRPRCGAGGLVYITPLVDVQVVATGFYQFNLPTDPMQVGAGLAFFRTSPTQTVFGIGDTRNTLFGPLSGTIPLNTSGILTAGHTYFMQYQAQVAYLGGGASGLHATGNGELHIIMTAIPEPATLGLLAIALLTRRWRAGRASSGSSRDR